MELRPYDSVKNIKGCGKKAVEELARHNIRTVRQLAETVMDLKPIPGVNPTVVQQAVRACILNDEVIRLEDHTWRSLKGCVIKGKITSPDIPCSPGSQHCELPFKMCFYNIGALVISPNMVFIEMLTEESDEFGMSRPKLVSPLSLVHNEIVYIAEDLVDSVTDSPDNVENEDRSGYRRLPELQLNTSEFELKLNKYEAKTIRWVMHEVNQARKIYDMVVQVEKK